MRIALLHGFPGFSKIFGLSYFHGVEDHLNSRFRDLDIFAPQLAPPFGLDTVPHRAGQLRDLLEKQFPGSEKIHLIAHSAGGIDARLLAAPAPGLDFGSRLTSITTISTPHHGSRIADVLAGPAGAAAHLVPALGGLAEAIQGYTTAAVHDFNRRIGNAPGVSYFSYAGVKALEDPRPLGTPFFATGFFVNSKEGPNDGWVSVGSASFPQFKGTVAANHLEEVGLDPLGSFDHLGFFERIVADLGGARR